ncbi:MAG: hypothetical protein AAFV49_22730, partial [Pseudomonadota bacterium]
MGDDPRSDAGWRPGRSGDRTGPDASPAASPAPSPAASPAAPAAGSTLDRFASALILAAARAPRLVLAATGLLMLLAVLAATRLGVDTDSSRMLNPALPFQERAQAINAAFPRIKNTVLVVVRAPHQSAVDAVTEALATRLAARADAIESVFAPSADRFLVAHGLLYRDLAEVESALSR